MAGPGLVWKELLTLTMGPVVRTAGYGNEALQRDLKTPALGVHRPTASLTLIQHMHFSKLTEQKRVDFVPDKLKSKTLSQ